MCTSPNQYCSKMLFRWRWIFSSRWLTPGSPTVDTTVARKLPAAALNLVFPDECRICGASLDNFSNIPICSHCLSAPQPLLAEHFCRCCQTPFLNEAPLDETGLCRLCSGGLTSFDRSYSFGEYSGELRKSIHLLKYGGIQPLSRPLGKLLLSAVPRDDVFDFIIPIPLHWRRRWKRGFNQSELLARTVAKRLGVPLCSGLKRLWATPSQAGLTNAQRRQNVAGAFVVSKKSLVVNKHVLLIDDVLTTGATVNAAAAALKKAGARRVTVLTLARVDRRRPSRLEQ
jgi:ComF family protein